MTWGRKDFARNKMVSYRKMNFDKKKKKKP